MMIDSLKGFRIVGVCSGHRHSMVLDEHGCLYTFGSGASGALGHGDLIGQEYPMKVMEFGKLLYFLTVPMFAANIDTQLLLHRQ